MIRLVSVGVSVIVIILLGYYVYVSYYLYPAVKMEPSSQSQLKEVKTDFISIAVFRNGGVAGYLSFRVSMTMSEPARMPEAAYYIADAVNRRPALSSSLVDETLDPAIAVELEKTLQETLVKKMGAEAIGKLEVVDLAFDRRIQPDA